MTKITGFLILFTLNETRTKQNCISIFNVIFSDTGIPDIEIENKGIAHDSTAMQGTVNSILLSISA